MVIGESLALYPPEQEVRIRACLIYPQEFAPTTVVPEVETATGSSWRVGASVQAPLGSKLVRRPPPVWSRRNRNRIFGNVLKLRIVYDAGYVLWAGGESEITDRFWIHAKPVVVFKKHNANRRRNRRKNKT